MESDRTGGQPKAKRRELISAGRKIAASPRHAPIQQRRPAGGGVGGAVGGQPLGLGALQSARSAVGVPTEPLVSEREGGLPRSTRSLAKSPSCASESSCGGGGGGAASAVGLVFAADAGASSPLGGGAGAGQPPDPAAAELAKGGAALLKRLADVGNNNVELRRQIEQQTREISVLEESGKVQQRLLQEFERHAEQARQGEALAAEARVRAEGATREAQLREEMDELKTKAQQDREELLEQIRKADAERSLREGERDEARAQVRDLESRLRSAMGAPEQMQARVRALEMELNLVRSRFAKEVALREAAQQAAREAKEQQNKLQASLDRASAETQHLRRAVTEQVELIAFRQEVSNDLQTKLQQQKLESEKRLVRERGKLEVVARLEGVLPRNLIIKALA